MLQCLEWEPSGSFYQTGGIPPSGAGTGIGQNGAPGPSRVNYSQDISDPTLPPNPRKTILYRPSVTNFLAVSSCTFLVFVQHLCLSKKQIVDSVFSSGIDQYTLMTSLSFIETKIYHLLHFQYLISTICINMVDVKA